MDQIQYKQASGKWRPIALTVLICLMALAAVLTMNGKFPFFAIILLAVMGGVFAVQFATAKTQTLVVVSASISIAILQVLGGFLTSAIGLVVMIAAMVLSYQVRKRESKTTVLVTASLILGGGLLLLALIFYAIDGGSLAPSDLLDAYQAFFRELKIALSKQVHAMIARLDEKTLALYAQMNITKEMLTETYLDSMEYAVDTVQLILPGILIFAIQLLAYLQLSVFRLTARAIHVDALLPEPRWHLLPTQISCIVYIVVAALYMLGSLFSDGSSILMVILANMWLVLLPTMLLCGFRVLFARLAHPFLRVGTGMILVLFLIGFFMIPAQAIRLALFVLSFLGAQTVSAMHMMESGKNKKQQ